MKSCLFSVNLDINIFGHVCTSAFRYTCVYTYEKLSRRTTEGKLPGEITS